MRITRGIQNLYFGLQKTANKILKPFLSLGLNFKKNKTQKAQILSFDQSFFFDCFVLYHVVMCLPLVACKLLSISATYLLYCPYLGKDIS